MKTEAPSPIRLPNSGRAPAASPAGSLAGFFKRLGLQEVFDSADGDKHSRMHRALLHIEQHLASDLSITETARIACYTPRHFLRVFREVFGESASGYIKRLRMEKAAQILRYYDISVLDAAHAVGYESASGFARAFTDHHSLPPTAYREKNRAPFPCSSAASSRWSLDRAPIPLRLARLPAMRVAFLRHIGNPVQSLSLWLRLLSWAWRKHLFLSGKIQPIGLVHDGKETPPDLFRYDVCIQVPANSTADGSGIGIRDLPGGLVLMHDFRGRLTVMAKRWDFFCDVCFPQTGLQIREGYALDLFSPSLATPRRLASILASRDPIIETTMCVPVQEV